jgi:hypothetical protein
LKDPD